VKNAVKRVFYVVNTSIGQIPGLPPGNGRPRNQDEFPPGWSIEETVKVARENNLLTAGETAEGFSCLWTGGSQEFAHKVILTQTRKPNPFLTWVALPTEDGDDFADPGSPGQVLPDNQ